MSALNKDFLRELRADLDAALDVLAKKHEITLKAGHCTFDPWGGNFTFKLEGTAKGGVDKAGTMYNMLQRIRPKLPALHSTFVYDGKTHEIVGANSTRSKIITNCGGKGYQFPIDAVESLCAK